MIHRLNPVHFKDFPLLPRDEAVAGAAAAYQLCSAIDAVAADSVVLEDARQRMLDIASTYWEIHYQYFLQRRDHRKLKSQLQKLTGELVEMINSRDGQSLLLKMSQQPLTRIGRPDFLGSMVKQLEDLHFQLKSTTIDGRRPGQPAKKHCLFIVEALVGTWEELFGVPLPQTRMKARGANGHEYVEPGLLFVAQAATCIDPKITKGEIDSAIKTLWDTRVRQPSKV